MVWGGRREEGSGWGTHVKKKKKMKGHPDSVALLLIQLDTKVYLSKGILE